MTPSLSNLSSSLVTGSLNAYGTGLALSSFGVTLGLILRIASISLIRLNYFTNYTLMMFEHIIYITVFFMKFKDFHYIFNFINQLRPSRLGTKELPIKVSSQLFDFCITHSPELCL